jgi:hypothetical protein
MAYRSGNSVAQRLNWSLIVRIVDLPEERRRDVRIELRQAFAASGSASRISERDQGVGRFAVESKWGPGVTVVTAFPELAVGETGEQATIAREERVGHRR